MSSALARATSREQRLPYIYIAPALAVLVVFGLLPILFTMAMSLFRWDAIKGFDTITFGGIDNFVWIFVADDWFGSALINGLWHTAVSGVLIHVSAIPLAAFINQAFQRWRPVVMALYFLPFLMSGVVVYIILSTLFSGGETGMVNAAFMALGNLKVLGVRPLAIFFPVEPVLWFRLHGEGLSVMATWWQLLGWNVLLYVTALQYVPKVLLESARIDGANALQTLRYIIVPQLRPMIFFAASLTVVSGLSWGGERSLSGYMQYVAYEMGDYGAAAAMAVTLLLVLAGLIYVLWAHIGGRPEMPHDTQPEALTLNEAPRTTWIMLAMAWLRRTLVVPEPTDPNTLRGFAGMRAIACIMIIVHHLSQRLDGDWALLWLFKPIWALALRMDMGVCLFFVLSGALLSMPFWQRFLGDKAPPSLGDYALRRAARILPGYWVALGISALLGVFAIPEAPWVLRRFIAGATFVSGLHYTTFFPSELDPALWSISFEFLCYLMLPLLLLPMWRLLPGREPRRAWRYLIWVLAGLQFAHLAIVANFPTDEFERGWQWGLMGGAKEWLPYWSPASFMTQFMLGGMASFGIAWKQRVAPKRSPDFDRLAVWSLLVAWLLYALFGGGLNSITRQPYITPLFPGLIAFALFAMQFGHRLYRWLDNRFFNFVATHSFGLYLWHFVVIELIRVYWVPEFKNFQMRNILQWLMLSGLVVAVSMLLAWISWRVLERPALRWARARRARGVVASSVAVSA